MAEKVECAAMPLSERARRVFDGPEVALPAMLDARERRAAVQARLLDAAPADACLLCATLSIPGPRKTSPVLRALFDRLVESAHARLAGVELGDAVRLAGPTGPELVEVVLADAREVKLRVAEVEESDPCGRLIDLDVLTRTGDSVAPISRIELGLAPRRCLICGGEAKACARSRTHTVIEMQEKIAEIIEQGGCL